MHFAYSMFRFYSFPHARLFGSSSDFLESKHGTNNAKNDQCKYSNVVASSNLDRPNHFQPIQIILLVITDSPTTLFL
jgi:hypothetical protein